MNTDLAIRVFFRIAELWQVSEETQLALLGEGVNKEMLTGWKAEPPPRLADEIVFRLSALIGLYEGLEQLYRHAPESQATWLCTPRPTYPCDGATPLDFIVTGGLPAILSLRAYVYSINGGRPARHSTDSEI